MTQALALATGLVLSAQVTPVSGSALVVGVEKLPAQKAQVQTLGATKDVEIAKGALSQAGFKVSGPLLRQQATLTSVKQGLQTLASQAAPGAWSVFYYSGLGTIFADGSRGLATWNSDARSSAQDFSLKDLNAWAESVREKQGIPLAIIDACWAAVPTQARSQTLSVRQVPKFLSRPGQPKAAAFPKLPAIILLSSGTDGIAFEEKYNTDQSSDAYRSGFTVRMFERSLAKAMLGQPPLLSQMMSQIIIDFGWLSANGILLNQSPEALVPPELQAEYRKPFLGLGPGTPGLTTLPPVRSWAKLSVFLDNDPDPGMALDPKRRPDAQIALTQALKKEFASSDLIELVEREWIWPDRRILLGGDPDNPAGFGAWISGSVEEGIAGFNTLSQASRPADLVTAKQMQKTKDGLRETGLTLAQALKKLALTRWLHRLTEVQAPTLPAKLSIEPVSEEGTIFVGDPFMVRIVSSHAGTGVLMTQDGWESGANLIFPSRSFSKTDVKAEAKNTFPSLASSPYIMSAPPGREGISSVKVLLLSGSVPPATDFSHLGQLNWLTQVRQDILDGKVLWASADAFYTVKQRRTADAPKVSSFSAKEIGS